MFEYQLDQARRRIAELEDINAELKEDAKDQSQQLAGEAEDKIQRLQERLVQMETEHQAEIAVLKQERGRRPPSQTREP
jgi:hypothetical protein